MTLFQVGEWFTPPENLLWNLKMMACPIPMGTIFHVQNFHIFKTNPRLGVISWPWMKKPMLRMRRIRRSLPLLAPFLSLLICLAPQEIHHKTYPWNLTHIHKYPKQYLKGEWFGDIFDPNHPSFCWYLCQNFGGVNPSLQSFFGVWNAMEDSGWGREEDGSSLEVVLGLLFLFLHGWSTPLSLPTPEGTFAQK